MFPNNEFWQCPSYTWSSFIFGSIIFFIIWLVSLTKNKTAISATAAIGGIFMLGWGLYTLFHWFKPNKECAAVGYPGQHHINPFYKSEMMDYTRSDGVPKKNNA